MKIGELIKQKRVEKGWSIDKVVEELKIKGIDINKSSLSRIEKGETQKIDSALLATLANIYKFNFFKYLGYNFELNDIEIETSNTQKKVKDPLYAYIDMLDSQQRDMVKAMLKGLVEKK